MAEQIRAAVDEYLSRAQADEQGAILQPDDPIFKLMGMFDSGLSDVSVNHDYYLYGAPKRVPDATPAVREREAAYKARPRRRASRRKSTR
jgi:hypothetical protein